MTLPVKFGQSIARIDGVAKVTGAARYASDEPLNEPAYAYLVVSSIARGKILGFDLHDAQAVPHVLQILTHETVGNLVKPAPGPDGQKSTTSLEDATVWHAGQIIGIVVAETFEAAREAARKVKVRYSAETPSAALDSPGVTIEPHEPARGADPEVGNAGKAFADAAVKVDAEYRTPTQHHNPIELFTTSCAWDNDKLMIFDPSQYMWGTKTSNALRLGIDPERVRAVSRFIGGAFGSKGPNPRTAWIALAAKRVGRPVKLVPTRDQGFTIATHRAETRQKVSLGATREGKLSSLIHEGWELTSRPSGYSVAGVESTARMYGCANIDTAVHVVHADRATPGYMRAPPETPYMFALESAMDELAYALKMDPIELRRRNDTQKDPVSGLPFTSRSLIACFDQAAARFGWDQRKPEPALMSDGDWQVGYGCATACYPSNQGPAAVRLALTADGKAHAAMAGHEIGTGAYTTIAIAVAQFLGLDMPDVTVVMGDSDLPPIMIAGGSNNAASATAVVAKACEDIRARIAKAAVAAPECSFHGADPKSLKLVGHELRDERGQSEPLKTAMARVAQRIEVYAENVPHGLPSSAMADLIKGKQAMLGGSDRKDATAYAFGAHLVEVRVHKRTREVRVARIVSAFAAGTIINERAARSQLMGGAIWGVSAALHEATEVDPKTARYVNNNLADYLIPVNADIPAIQIIIVPETDSTVNPLGVKGIGEIGIVGMNAAIANAVYHATGRRIRDLPIRAEKLI